MRGLTQGSVAPPVKSSLQRIAFACSAAAAGIHLGAVHAHASEWAPAAVFMLASGLAQLAWSFALLGNPRPWLIEAGIAGNASIIALWIVSRTVGLPVGPMQWRPEHVHGNDVAATFLEIILIVAAIRMARQSDSAPHPTLSRLCALGVVAAVALAGHDQPHERAATIATLAIAAVAGYARPSLNLLVHVDWRKHVKSTSGHPGDAGRRTHSGPVTRNVPADA